MSLLIPGQSTVFRARNFVHSIPFCPWCRIFKISDLKVSGTTTCKSFKINPLYKASESFMVKYGLTFVVFGSVHLFWNCNIPYICVSVIICCKRSSLTWHDYYRMDKIIHLVAFNLRCAVGQWSPAEDVCNE